VEFDLIESIRVRAVARDDVLLGIGDDAALLQPPPGQALAVSTDTLNAGVHFPQETAPADLGWKALAVNLSDLAAMGAQPAWCTLSLSLPQADPAWLDAFLDGFLALAQGHAIALVGGDTTRGPLSVGVTVHGFVPAEFALRRTGARVGDEIWITGTIGDAAAALAQWRAGDVCDPALRARLDRPTPRIEAGLALRGLAHAAVDVSDGLLADLAHVLRASDAGAVLQAQALPHSPALAARFDATRRLPLQLAGGDDYELCFCAPPAAHAAIGHALAAVKTPAAVIGRVVAEPGLHVVDAAGNAIDVASRGFEHFTEAGR
jgi:thiamine-monophosphate kinase